jgi:hypothetical protein
VNGRELAESLGLNPKWLRELVRKHGLAPAGHVHGEEYDFDLDDRKRVARHPAVRQAIENRRM